MRISISGPAVLADQRGELGRLALVLARHGPVEIAVALLAGLAIHMWTLLGEGVEFERGVSGLHDVLDLGDHALFAGKLALVGVGVERDFIPHRAPQKLVDGLIEGLAPDVPQGDVDRAHAFYRGAAAAHVGEAAKELVPELLDARRVFADQHGADLPQHRGQAAICDLCCGGNLAPTGDPLVGVDLDEQELSPVRGARLYQPGPDTRYLHFTSAFFKRRYGSRRNEPNRPGPS